MRPITVDGYDVQDLCDGWELADADPDEHDDPSGIGGLDWMPAEVPGTVASALRTEGRFPLQDAGALDERDWWFRTQFDCAAAGPSEEVVLALAGGATVAEG
jgi:beta-mannosidase